MLSFGFVFIILFLFYMIILLFWFYHYSSPQCLPVCVVPACSFSLCYYV